MSSTYSVGPQYKDDVSNAIQCSGQPVMIHNNHVTGYYFVEAVNCLTDNVRVARKLERVERYGWMTVISCGD